MRETFGVDETGRKFCASDSWTESKGPSTLPQRWTGMTVFRVNELDDQKYGGDQRRQRDRIGEEDLFEGEISNEKRKKLRWADEFDIS